MDTRLKIATERQKQGTLKKGNNYYWNFKENRLLHLKEYIDQYGFVNGMSKLNSSLHNAIIKHDNNNIASLVAELGYEYQDLSKHYIDKRGDYNRSLGELYFANWLIENGLRDKYDRDVIIDATFGKYNSDFRIIPKDENCKEIRIEIWGFNKKSSNYFCCDYLKNRKIKEQLYKTLEDDMILVSIEPEDILCDAITMQENFSKKMSPYLNIDFKCLEWERIRSSREFSEQYIYEQLINISKNGKIPPKENIMQIAGSQLYTQIKKFGGLNYFVKKYDLTSSQKDNFWSNEKVYEVFIFMLQKYKKILTKKEIGELKHIDTCLCGFIDYVRENNGLIYWKIKFCEYLIDGNIKLDADFNPIDYLKSVLEKRDREFKRYKGAYDQLINTILHKNTILNKQVG